MAKGITVEKLNAQLAALDARHNSGSVNDKDYAEQKAELESMRRYIEKQPTRESGSTEESVREYAKLANLNAEQTAEVESLMKTLDAGVARLRELVGKVTVERTDKDGKTVQGHPRPRWFCNVVEIKAKDGAESGAAPASAPAGEPVPAGAPAKGKGKGRK